MTKDTLPKRNVTIKATGKKIVVYENRNRAVWVNKENALDDYKVYELIFE